MCFFHYNQCDGCRYPDTSTITVALECDEFLAGVADGRIPPLHNLHQAMDRFVSTSEESWESVQLGLTVARKRDGMWEIKPPRACVRWMPAPVQWVCDACLNSLYGCANDITAPVDNLEQQQVAVAELPASSRSIPDLTSSSASSNTLVEPPEQTNRPNIYAAEIDSSTPASAWEQVASGSISLFASAGESGQFDWETFENGCLAPDDAVGMLEEGH